MEYQYIITINDPRGGCTLTESDARNAVIAKLKDLDDDVERYGPDVAGFSIKVQAVR